MTAGLANLATHEHPCCGPAAGAFERDTSGSGGTTAKTGEGARQPQGIPISEFPATIWRGRFALAGVRVRVYVLDTGARILNAADLETLLRRIADPSVPAPTADDFLPLATFCRGEGVPG